MLIVMIINNNTIKSLILCALLFILTSCQQKTHTVSTHQLYVFGTLVEINVWHDNPEHVRLAIDEISDTFGLMHHQWHAWKPGRLHEINQSLRSGKSVALYPEEANFIQQTIYQSKLSEHLFNPVMGELIDLWGFHADEYPLLTPPPAMQSITHLLDEHLTVDVLSLDGLNLSSSNPRVWLDYGGIAKGYAVDRAIRILNQHDINNAIVNAGGDLRSIGSKGRSPWRIAIQSPTNWSMVAEIEVNQDEAIFTSGNYQRYKEFDGKRYSHIIDPRTGMPVNQIVSATVIADSGIAADAAATALVVAGSEQWQNTAKQMGIKQALIINENDVCFATKDMISRLEQLSIVCESIE